MRSWLACTLIVVGFIVGGVALIYWNWPVFWIGVAIVVVGSIFGWAVNIMEDVSEYGGGTAAASDPESASY
jgi:Co/Zn/Cd efflux system component